MDQALRPMSTAQVLDRTFFLYRRNFVLFAGIAAVPPAFVLVAQMIGFAIPKAANNLPGSAAGIAAVSVGAVVAVILYLIGSSLATGASFYAVSSAHLGKQTTISESYRSVKNRVGAILGTSLCMGLVIAGAVICALLPMAILTPILAKTMGGSSLLLMIPVWAVVIFFLIRLMLRYTLAIPACVLEKTGPIESLKRSFFLARGSEGRIFLILLLFIAIVMALTIVFSMPAIVAAGVAASKGAQPPFSLQILKVVSSFIASTLSGPIYTIAFSLVYYDQRVRKEAFDLTLMMEAIGQAPPQAAAASAGTPTSIG
jgi:hypothetical protein